jgi:translocation protein SEC63
LTAFKTNVETADVVVSRTSTEQTKARAIQQELRMQPLKTRGFLINLGITCFFTIVFVWLLYNVSADGQVQSFDPFAILEIDSGADNKIIKKAYRRLSLLYHPDKNPGDRAAEAKFMMVSKAYEALTDEAAKENWEKYGNPDGKQSLEVSIGLPDFLLDTNNRNLVLVAYLVIMVGVIPFCVWTYYSDSSKYGEKDVMYDTYSWYHHTLSEHALIKSLPEALAGSAEFRQRNVPVDPQEKQEIAALTTQVRSQMQKPNYNHPVCVKGNVLLHAHLLRKTDDLSLKNADDLKYMLRTSSALIEAMISVCKHQDWMQTAIHCIEFGQYVTQAMWIKDSPLLQLPHFTAAQVQQCAAGKSPITTIQQFRECAAEEKKGLSNFTAQQKRDVEEYLKIFPDITVETKVFVDDDEDPNVYEGDLVTVQVLITRNNLHGGDKVGMVHAPFFPFPKKEAWYIILGQLNAGKIISIEKIGNPGQTIESRIKLMAPPKGTYVFDLLVKSNAYVGCDYKTKVDMECQDNSVLPEYKVHPDDAELDDEPTLFEEMLNANIEQDSDDEDSDDDDEVDKDNKGGDKDTTGKKAMSAAEKKKEQMQKARQAAEDDDDSDSDVEEVYTSQK